MDLLITTIKAVIGYSRADYIWNIEESGLFFKALPDTGLANKPEKFKGELEKVKLRDVFENCLILLNRMVCSIFTAK